MKIVVVGTGGLGGYFGGLLAKACLDVTFVARGEYREAINQHGLTVKSVVGDFHVHPVKTVNSISAIENPDVVLFTVKTYDTERAAEELKEVVKDSTFIISFQNGIDNDEVIKKYINSARVIPGLAYIASTRTAPGVIEQTGGARKLIFGDRVLTLNAELEQVAALMKSAGVNAAVSKDITSDLWRKFIFICAFSGMTALCRSTIGKILADPTAAKCLEACVREGIDIARAVKVNLAENIFEDVIGIIKSFPAVSKSSLLVDVENGRRTEIDSLSGTLVRLAHEHQINAPVHEVIYSGIKLL